VRHDSYIRVTWPVQVLSYLHRALYICTHICVFTYRRLHVCAMTHMYVWHDPCRFYHTSIAPQPWFLPLTGIYICVVNFATCVTWLLHVCDATDSPCHVTDSPYFHICVIWILSIYVLRIVHLIQVCVMNFVFVHLLWTLFTYLLWIMMFIHIFIINFLIHTCVLNILVLIHICVMNFLIHTHSCVLIFFATFTVWHDWFTTHVRL